MFKILLTQTIDTSVVSVLSTIADGIEDRVNIWHGDTSCLASVISYQFANRLAFIDGD